MGHDLNEVLGALFGSVAEARSLSDRVSRQLALLYEKDDLMRAFPVPRVDLSQIDVDLKFSPSEVIPGHAPPAATELVAASVLKARAAVVEAVAQGFLKERYKSPGELDYSQIGGVAAKVIESVISEPTERVLSQETPGDIKTFDVEKCVARMLKELVAADLLVPKEGSEKAVAAVIGAALTPAAKDHEEAVATATAGAAHPNGQVRILFLQGELASLPEQAVSTMRLSLKVKDYEWHQVGVTDKNEPLRKLVPE